VSGYSQTGRTSRWVEWVDRVKQGRRAKEREDGVLPLLLKSVAKAIIRTVFNCFTI
jgi:hypothetical protein